MWSVALALRGNYNDLKADHISWMHPFSYLLLFTFFLRKDKKIRTSFTLADRLNGTAGFLDSRFGLYSPNHLS